MTKKIKMEIALFLDSDPNSPWSRIDLSIDEARTIYEQLHAMFGGPQAWSGMERKEGVGFSANVVAQSHVKPEQTHEAKWVPKP